MRHFIQEVALKEKLWNSMIKRAIQVFSILLAGPFALLTGFGRCELLFQFFAHAFALIPGIAGDYLRVAYYFLTLEHCSLNSRISFGTFFVQSSSTVGKNVYIGAYCVLGPCDIGERSQIASHVQVLAGRRQHARTAEGHIMGSDRRSFTTVTIGSDCWIGASAVVMADIGARTTIGAGAIVPRPVPAGVVAAGNPARILKPISVAARANDFETSERKELVC